MPKPCPRTWRLAEAKAQFSEVVRRARSDGPQRVTVRGKPEVVIIAADEWQKLARRPVPRESLVDLLSRLHLHELDVTRPDDRGRTIGWTGEDSPA